MGPAEVPAALPILCALLAEAQYQFFFGVLLGYLNYLTYTSGQKKTLTYQWGCPGSVDRSLSRLPNR